MAHSSAYAEWADPSMPTVIPGISCLLLRGLSLPAARTLLPLLFRRHTGTRDLRARQRAIEPDQDGGRAVLPGVPAVLPSVPAVLPSAPAVLPSAPAVLPS